MKRNPKLNIRVYSVWYEMYPGDSRRDFPNVRKLLPDRRVKLTDQLAQLARGEQ